MIPHDFDAKAWADDHAAEQKRLLEENGGQPIVITMDEIRAGLAKVRAEYEAMKRA